MATKKQWLDYLVEVKQFEGQWKSYQKELGKWIRKTFPGGSELDADADTGSNPPVPPTPPNPPH
jgi:hypothetical protein